MFHASDGVRKKKQTQTKKNHSDLHENEGSQRKQWRSWYVHLVVCGATPETLLWGEGVCVPEV